MVKMGIFFDFHFPSVILPHARKSMNLLDIIIAEKNQSEKNSVKYEKTQENSEKNLKNSS